MFSQSLGVLAQLRAGDTANAAAPIAYLRGLQTPNGSWPSLIPATGDADVDSTAMAVMALSLVPGDEAAQAVDRGLAWLAGKQETDGGFPGAAGNSTNSAALAVQGMTLRQAAYAGPIAKAVEFLADRQNGDGGFDVAASGQQGSDVRASTQALGGVTGISFGTLKRDLGATPPYPSGSPSPSPSASTSPSPSASTPPSASPSESASTSPSAAATSTTQLPSTESPVDSTAGPQDPDLAWTGTDVLGLVGPAVLLTVAGGAILVATRRRTATKPGRHQ
ncbi:terpene cyclase/mutase family protein [Kitasatospora sp. NBC_00070]